MRARLSDEPRKFLSIFYLFISCFLFTAKIGGYTTRLNGVPHRLFINSIISMVNKSFNWSKSID